MSTQIDNSHPRESFPDSSVGKDFACNTGDPSSIPGLGRSSGEGIGYPLHYSWASLVAQLVKNLPAMRETWVWSLGWEEPLEKGKATHSSILEWELLIPEFQGLYIYSPWGHKELGTTEQLSYIYMYVCIYIYIHMHTYIQEIGRETSPEPNQSEPYLGLYSFSMYEKIIACANLPVYSILLGQFKQRKTEGKLMSLFPFVPTSTARAWLYLLNTATWPWIVAAEGLRSGNVCNGVLTGLLTLFQRRQWHPTPVLLPGKSMDRGAW